MTNAENNTINLFMLPFVREICKKYPSEKHIRCDIDPLSSYRQSVWKYQKDYPVVLILSNFAILYSPYIQLLASFLRNNTITLDFNDHIYENCVLELDLQPLIELIHPNHLIITIRMTGQNRNSTVIIHSPLKKTLTSITSNFRYFSFDLIMSSEANETLSKSMTYNDELCYSLTLKDTDNATEWNGNYSTCPSNTCRLDGKENRPCIGVKPCHRTGFTSLLCRIERLQPNDRFNFRHPLPYSDIIIITTDPHKDTVHRFSHYLLESCVTRRLVIVILHGRLKIPSLNSTSFHCPDGLTVQVEFWHGNCSTYDIVYETDIERMYGANLITLGNFYTGRMNRLNISCMAPVAIRRIRKRMKLSILSWILFATIGVVIHVTCGILVYYHRQWSRYRLTRAWSRLIGKKKPDIATLSIASNSFRALSNISYDEYYFSVALSDEVPTCIFPFAQRQCRRDDGTQLECFTDPMYRERYFKCDHASFPEIYFQSNNLLLMYPPFIDIILAQFASTSNVTLSFIIETDLSLLDIDLQLVTYARPSLDLAILIVLSSMPARVLFRTHSTFEKHFSFLAGNPMSMDFLTVWHVTSADSERKNDLACYNFEIAAANISFSIPSATISPCPPPTCLADTDKVQTCIESNPCLYMGSDILLCRIERLQSEDQFNRRHRLLYSNIVIITTDTQNNTVHRFSHYLLESCITRRLVIVILHGRLEIPSLNFTSFHCPDGLTVEVEFWHGNCSTYEIVYDADTERMYGTDLITSRNFYTGRQDGLEMACAVDPSQAPLSIKQHVSNIIVAFLLIVVMVLMCVVGWQYRRSSS